MSLNPLNFVDTIAANARLIATGALAVVVIGLVLLTRYYHIQYVNLLEKNSALTTELASAIASAKSCSDGVSELQAQTELRDKLLVEAKKKAETLAKKNEALAQELLKASPKFPNDTCKSVTVLFQDYLTEIRKARAGQ